jgi:hypothetical protein
MSLRAIKSRSFSLRFGQKKLVFLFFAFLQQRWESPSTTAAGVVVISIFATTKVSKQGARERLRSIAPRHSGHDVAWLLPFPHRTSWHRRRCVPWW